MKLLRHILLLLLLAAALCLPPVYADVNPDNNPAQISDDTAESDPEPAEPNPDAPAEQDSPEEQDAPEEDTPDEQDAEPDSEDAEQTDDSTPKDNADDNDQIEEAPPVDELPGGVGDLDVDGPCIQDIETFCGSVKPGGSHLAECIQNQIKDEEQGKSEFTAQVTEACKAEVLSYKMKLVGNINMDKDRREACKADAKKMCGDVEWNDAPGKVIACLTELRPKLSKKCADSIYQAQLDAAQDYRLNAMLYEECKEDADSVCAPVEPGEGRVNTCLRDRRSEV